MKTKTKILTLMEIAVVLCSMFLVAIPAIAADQTTQEVSASSIIAASEEDYVLDIYGNANEDDTIDMGDVVYTKLAIFGKKPKTELCDAKYDGRINVLDVIQTKLIILGKEKELTYENSFGKAETVRKPVQRIASGCVEKTHLMRVLNVQDKIVGMHCTVKACPIQYPELSKLPCVKSGSKTGDPPDYELVLSLHSDVYLPCVHKTRPERMDEFQKKLPGVTVIALSKIQPLELETYTGDVRKFGYIFDKENEAEEFIAWHDEILNTIQSRTAGLSDDEKPLVFIEWASPFRCIRLSEPCDLAGGRNICAHLSGTGSSVLVDPEWVVEQNPDIIFRKTSSGFGFGVDNPSKVIEEREKIMNRHELAHVTAVSEEMVYLMYSGWVDIPPRHVVGIAYMAKLFHPELFEDLDPEAIQQEYVTRFQHLDYNLDEHGIFFYPPIEIDGGLAGIPDRYYDSIISQP